MSRRQVGGGIKELEGNFSRLQWRHVYFQLKSSVT